MAPLPAFGRSLTSHPWGGSANKSPSIRQDGDATSTTESLADTAIASSSTSLLHPHSRQGSNVNATESSARSRTRSVGADGHSYIHHHKGPPVIAAQDLFRGPGTPDITLDAFEEIRGRRDSPVSSKSRLSHADTNTEDVRRKRSSSDVLRSATPTRPRLANQLRSFISSFKVSSAAHTPTEEKEEDAFSTLMSKARSSNEDERNKESAIGRIAQTRPKALVMPSARPAGPDGMCGLNNDSPPLTPVSDEAKDSDSVDIVRELTYASSLRHPWSVAQARADGNAVNPTLTAMDRDCMTPTSSSTIQSGRSSPLLSSHSVGSSAGTYIPSRPTSSLAMFKHSTSPFSALLPSHAISPSSSPSPPEHATKAYWHTAPTTSIFSNLLSQLSFFMSNTRLPPLRRHLPALVFLMTAFIGSTICILLALSTLPLHLPSHITDLTIAEIRDMSLHLQAYSRSSTKAYIHTLSVLATFYTWKQSFTIPGSLIMNVVFGAMYGTWMATLYTSVLTSLGGVFCYLLMAPLGSLIRTLPGLHAVLEKMQRAMNSSSGTLSRHSAPLTLQEQQTRSNTTRQSSGNIWSYLLILRVLPIVPYGLMNIACSVLRVPLLPYAVTLAVGSIPWNACTVQVGDLLVQVVSALDQAGASSEDGPTLHGSTSEHKVQIKAQSGARAIAAALWNKEMIFKLILMSLVSLAPLLLQRYLKRSNETDEASEEHNAFIDKEDDESVGMELYQEASSNQALLPAWRSSWSSIPPSAASGAISRQSSPPFPDSSPSKRFSGLWTMNSEERMMTANRKGSTREEAEDTQSRKYPSIKRAVAASRVG